MSVPTGRDVAEIFRDPIAVGAWNNEYALQRWLNDKITEAGGNSIRELRLSDLRSRIDIFVSAPVEHGVVAGVGIEVKIKGSAADVLRQLERYAKCEEITELVLVTTKSSHLRMPATLNGKPLTVIPFLEGGL